MSVQTQQRTLDEELRRLSKVTRDLSFRISLRAEKQITRESQYEIDDFHAELKLFLQELDRKAHLEKIKVMRKVLKILEGGKDKK